MKNKDIDAYSLFIALPMNYQKALHILHLNIPITIETIRKQYKCLALQWHPDKNKSPNAADKYREIKEAHDYLIQHLNLTQHNKDELNAHNKSYASLATMFFETMYNNEHFQRHIFHPLLSKIVGLCENKAKTFILSLDNYRATQLLTVLDMHRNVLHLSDDFFTHIRSSLSERNKEYTNIQNYKHIILNPNLTDLLQSNLFKFYLDKEQPNSPLLWVPLWIPESVYDKENIIIHCIPELPSGTWIDDNNNIHVEITENILEVFKKGQNKGIWSFSIGGLLKTIEIEKIKMISYQMLVLEGHGISDEFVSDNIFKPCKKSDIIVHLSLFMADM